MLCEIVVEIQTFLEFKLLLPSERGRVTSTRTVFARQFSDYGDKKTHCFAKFAAYIDNLVYNLRL